MTIYYRSTTDSAIRWASPAIISYGEYHDIITDPRLREPKEENANESYLKETIRKQQELLEKSQELQQQQVDLLQQQLKQKGEEPMQILSVAGVLTIMIIVIVTIKFVMPRLTWKYAIKRFVGLVWKPAKSQADEIKREWSEANKE